MATPGELLTALRRFGLENDRFDAIVARRLGVGSAEFKAMDHIQAAGSITPGRRCWTGSSGSAGFAASLTPATVAR